MEQVRPRQELPPPPPLRAAQGACHLIQTLCCTRHESVDAPGGALGVPRQILRHRGAGSRLRFQQRPEERPRHRCPGQVCAQDSGLASLLTPPFPPSNRVPCHNPQNSLNTSLAGVGAGSAGGSCDGGSAGVSLPRFFAAFFPTSSGSTGPFTADGLSGASGVLSLMGGSLRVSRPARLGALRVDFAAHPFPSLLVLLPQDGEPHLDGCPQNMRLRIPRTPGQFPNPTRPIPRKTHRDLLPFRLEFGRHAGWWRLLPPLVTRGFSLFLPTHPRRRIPPPHSPILSLSHP